MGIRFRATGIAIGVLLVVMLGQPAKADSFRATGQTDASYCAAVDWCSEITFGVDFTTEPPVLDSNPIGNVFLTVTSIFGEINGVAVSCTRVGTSPTCGDLLASRTNYSGPPIPDGLVWLIGSGGLIAELSAGPDSTVPFFTPYPIVRVNIGDSRAYTTWNIVSTPEPSTLLFLSSGLLGLMGLTLLKNRLS